MVAKTIRKKKTNATVKEEQENNGTCCKIGTDAEEV